jgi:membrane associated rhomboid family serine protease
VLPVQDVLPSRARPVVVLGLIAVSALALAFQLSLAPSERLGFTLAFGFVPAYASAATIASALLIQPDLIAGAITLLALWIFGDNVEDRLGHGRLAALYALGGVVAAGAVLGLDGDARMAVPISAAATTAVIGAHIALFPRAKILVAVPFWLAIELVEVPSMLIAAGWLLVHALRYAGTWNDGGVTAGASVVPLVGLAVGFAAGRLLRRPERMGPDWWSPVAGRLAGS